MTKPVVSIMLDKESVLKLFPDDPEMRVAFDNSVVNLLNDTATNLFDESFARRFAQKFNETLEHGLGHKVDMRELILRAINKAVESEVSNAMTEFHYKDKINEHWLGKMNEVIGKIDKYIDSVDIKDLLAKAAREYIREKLR